VDQIKNAESADLFIDPDKLLEHWAADDFTLVTSSAHLDELQRVLAYDKLQRFIHPKQSTPCSASNRTYLPLIGSTAGFVVHPKSNPRATTARKGRGSRCGAPVAG
jgi:hypothetical protein